MIPLSTNIWIRQSKKRDEKKKKNKRERYVERNYTLNIVKKMLDS